MSDDTVKKHFYTDYPITTSNGGDTNTKKKKKKPSKIRKIASKAKETLGKMNADTLSSAADTFGMISKMSASPSLSGGGQIQSQGGPDKVAFRADEYDKEAQRILKKLNA